MQCLHDIFVITLSLKDNVITRIDRIAEKSNKSIIKL